MHIPDNMIANSVCMASSALSVIALGAATVKAAYEKEKPDSSTFAFVTAFIFAVQLLNFPVAERISAHILGGTIAAGLLGVPFGIISISLVITIQAVFFGDGGIMAIGANILTMAVIGAGMGGFIRNRLIKFMPVQISTFTASWISVVLSAASCSAIVGLSGNTGFTEIFFPILSIHILAGIIEGAVSSFMLDLKIDIKKLLMPLAAMAITISPFASKLEDSMEMTLNSIKPIIHGIIFNSPFQNYSISGFNGIYWQLMAGFIGIAVAVSAGYALWYAFDFKHYPKNKRITSP